MTQTTARGPGGDPTVVAPTPARRESAPTTAPERSVGRVSVIIANYNYARYVGRAIDSALELDWPDVEVIVVDDGSTDDSMDVIRGYGDRIRVIEQENATQRVARNRGYEIATGDAIIHLDSDDVLRPQLLRRVAEVWRPGVSKVQVQMQRIDADDAVAGSVFPAFTRIPSAADVRRWAVRTSAYPTPPGSGNVYSRVFLDRIFPIDDRCGPATDSACLAAAPLAGDVVTIAEPLVGYRVHGDNVSNMLRDDSTYHKAILRAHARFRYSRDFMTDGERRLGDRPLRRSRSLLQLRIASARLTPDAMGSYGDSTGSLVRDVIASPFFVGPETIRRRVLVLLWAAATLAAPSTLARRLVEKRYGQHR